MNTDPLTFDARLIPRRDPSRLTLGDCRREFSRHTSPKLIAAALALALLARLAVGRFTYQDLIVPGFLLLSEPLTEWLIHVYILHSPGLRLGSLRLEPLAAPEHRLHHAQPNELRWVFIPTAALLAFIPAIAGVIALYTLPVHLLLGGPYLPEFLSGLCVGYGILLTYEWTHFLIHTPYRPRSFYYRLIWRIHRLHHYKNERFWFGVTSHLGDVALGTNPPQQLVDRSPTARALGGGVA
jgi:sterol desaturase/sphingolipid hydroxylase (fatty acid hydroxylase superfamily)